MRTWNFHPLLKVFFTLLTVFLLAFVVSVPLGIVGIWLPDFIRSRSGMLVSQALTSAVAFIVGAWYCAWLFDEQPRTLFPMGRVRKRVLGVALAGFVCALPAVNLIGIWNQNMELPAAYAELQSLIEQLEKEIQEATEIMVGGTSVGDLLVNLLVVALIPAIGEEMLFRGVIQRTLQPRYGLHAAVWITALLFGTVHFQFLGVIPRILLGAVRQLCLMQKLNTKNNQAICGILDTH